MRFVVTGGAGQLARAISRFCPNHEVLLPEERQLDLANAEAIEAVCQTLKPDVVINAGAFTQVDLCEAQPERAMLLNGTAVGWLAESCRRQGALLVQISTDYVFAGQGQVPHREQDPVNPQSVYGATKLAGEQAARTVKDHLILRTAWLYDVWGNNFLNTMLRVAADGKPMKVVSDQVGSPTSCRALARQIQAAVDAGLRGTYHATCHGETSWHGFAEEIFRMEGLAVDLSACSTDEFPRPARRPAYSTLSGEKRQLAGVDVMPSWQAALAEVMAERRTTTDGVRS